MFRLVRQSPFTVEFLVVRQSSKARQQHRRHTHSVSTRAYVRKNIANPSLRRSAGTVLAFGWVRPIGVDDNFRTRIIDPYKWTGLQGFDPDVREALRKVEPTPDEDGKNQLLSFAKMSSGRKPFAISNVPKPENESCGSS